VIHQTLATVGGREQGLFSPSRFLLALREGLGLPSFCHLSDEEEGKKGIITVIQSLLLVRPVTGFPLSYQG
jgi:hypothetical protein